MKKGLVLAIAAVFTFGLMQLGIPKSQAAFNPNLLIDDDVFSNSNTMSSAQIDNFLNSFPASCISTNNGFSAADPTGYNLSQGFLYGGAVSAGKVIYDAAQAYNINPQVLLATLQKEEGLVKGDGPYGCGALSISASVGYGCLDGGSSYSYNNLNPPLYWLNAAPVSSVSGTCVNSASKAGFSQQLIRAAWLLKFGQQRALGNTGWAIIQGNWDNSDDPTMCYSGPMTEGYHKRCSSDTNSVYYDGFITIDGQSVHMDSGATAALYWYTPHFSGNQSFVNLFTSWFGANYSPDLYTDSDNDGIMNRYDQCLFTPGSNIYMGCPDNTTLDSSGFSGDFNGDGYNDLVVFSVFPDGHTFNVWLYKGSTAGLKDPVLQMTLGPTHGGFDFQKSKAIAVNVNGDSYMDLVIFHQGPHDEVVRNVLLGSASGLQPVNASMTVWQTSDQGWNWSKLKIVGSGDFNGDGYEDVVALSEYADGHTFNVWLYPGSASSGLGDPALQMTLGPNSGGWDFNKIKAIAANVNGDGYRDLVILHQGPNDEVVRHVLKGSPSGLQIDDPNWVVWQFPSQGWKWSNLRLAGSGNFTGGSYDSIAVFSVFPDGHTFNVWLYPGSATGWQNSSFQMTLGPNSGGWDFVKSKPVAASVNNDGYRDLIILHQGPHNEVVRNILQGSSSGLAQNSAWTGWQFPSQGWQWSNIRTVRNSN